MLSSLWSVRSIRSCNWRTSILIISEHIMNCSWKHLQIKLSIKRWIQAITIIKWAESSEFFFVSFSLIWLLSCDIITVMWSKFDHLWIKSNSYKVHTNWTSRLPCSIHMNQTLSMFNLIQFDRSPTDFSLFCFISSGSLNFSPEKFDLPLCLSFSSTCGFRKKRKS